MTTPAPAEARTNVLAIISLVTSIIGFSLVGVITGHIGLSQIKKTGEQGRGLAIAGLIIGYLSIFFVLLWLVAFGGLSLLAIAASQGSVS
jgi:peptidyl-prolyl cis-trans isomerase B (cyclophilin B)